MLENCFTICTDCQYHFLQPKNEAAPGVWYNHVCLHNGPEEELDFVTGVMIPVQPPYCRDINKDGGCHYFKKKREDRLDALEGKRDAQGEKR